MAGDNVPYMTDPTHYAVRMRHADDKGKKPVGTDLGTYVFGLSIGVLTTIRSVPLLADWSLLYRSSARLQVDRTDAERAALCDELDEIHRTYKRELVRLSNEFLVESASRPRNQQFHAFNPAAHESSVGV